MGLCTCCSPSWSGSFRRASLTTNPHLPAHISPTSAPPSGTNHLFGRQGLALVLALSVGKNATHLSRPSPMSSSQVKPSFFNTAPCPSLFWIIPSWHPRLAAETAPSWLPVSFLFSLSVSHTQHYNYHWMASSSRPRSLTGKGAHGYGTSAGPGLSTLLHFLLKSS